MGVEDILRDMAVRGMRITEQRKTLARLFAEKDGYWTPKEVYERMSERYPGLSFDTVYRNLRQMHEFGILEQFTLDGGVKFRLRCEGHSGHHHHFICLGCDRVEPIDYCPMPDAAGLPPDAEVVRHRFEVFGFCGDCRESKGDGGHAPV